MAGEYSLSVILSAQNKAGGVISNFVSSLNPIAGGALAVGGAVVGIGVASVKMAADYQQSMNKVQALTGSSNAQMSQYDTGLKQLAVNAGVAPKALADGLYNVLSAGYSGANAMKVLTLATEDAKIGMTDSATTTKALTNVMANFNVKVSDATRVNGEMLQTVTLGKASFSDYANNITKAASTSAQFHEKMETMNAAWATLTANGISAGMATTDYDQSLQVMDGNIGTVSKSLNKNGIAFNETKFNAMDYGHKVVYLNQALEEAHAKHIKITGATVQASQAIKTISDHIKMYNGDLASLSNKQAMAQKTQQAWSITQGGFNQTMDRLKATLDVVMISIGQKLLPVVTSLANQIIPIVQRIGDWLIKSGALDVAARMLTNGIQGMVDVVSTLVGWGVQLVNFFQKNQLAMDALEAIVIGTGVALLIFAATQIPAMIVSLVAWAIAQWAVASAVLATAAPFILIGIIVAAVVLGIILAIQHWGAIMDWINGKAEQMRIKNEQAHVKMKIAADTNTAEQAKKAIANIDKERIGILQKLRETHDPAQRMELEHQLHMLNIQEQHQAKRLAVAEKDKAAQIAKQKQLHADMIEAQKNWFQRMLDGLGNFFGNVFSAIGTFTHNALNWFGQFFGGVFSALGTFVHNFLTMIDRWKAQNSAKINALLGEVKFIFAHLPQLALQWGQNLISGFISGISSKIGDLKNMASGAIQAVKNVLGFASPAKEGPGSNADEWAPNLMKMYVRGIQGGLPGIKVAVKNAAALMKAGFTQDALALNQKIDVAEYQLYLDKKAKAAAKWRADEAKHYATYLKDRQKALAKYESEKHHRKAFSYHAFKPLKETLPKFTGLALGAFANQTNILDPSMGNGAPMALPASQTSNNRSVIVDNSVNLVVHGSVVNHAQLLKDLQKQQDKNHRMQGTHVAVTSGGRAK